MSRNEIFKQKKNRISFQVLAPTVSAGIAALWVVTRVVLEVEGDKCEEHSAAFCLLPCRRRQYEPLITMLKEIMYLRHFVHTIYLHEII